MKDKLLTITNLFEGKEIRSIWDSEKEDYYFSVVDVIETLTESVRSRKYWNDLKKKLTIEGSELSEKVGQLKMESKKDGKKYLTDVLNTEGILRLIESIPSPKAEPFKLWLANLGSERIDEVFDPEIAIKRAIKYYQKQGYSNQWIESRIKSTLDRNKLTDVWKEGGIEKDYEFGILTNEIYKEWSGMRASEYKAYKNIRKENLRDNMTDVEIAIANIGELTTRDIAKNEKPIGLKQNKKVAKRGGTVARKTKNFYEEETGNKVISKENSLSYKYLNNNLIEK